MEKTVSSSPLKYQGYAIVLQEVPDEITLAFNISGCPYKCPDCHSKNLWNYDGRYIKEDFNNIFSKYKDYISCVCFMGGDQNINELYDLCKSIKDNKIKTAVFSGTNNINKFQKFFDNNMLDYIKVGSFNKELGGLDHPETNQIMYKIFGHKMTNINSRFVHTKM